MCGSVAKLQLRSVLKSVAQVTTEVGDLGWSPHLGWRCTTSGAIQTWVACVATWGPGIIWAQAAGQGHVWVCGLKQPGSRLTYVVPVASNGHEATQSQISHLSPGRHSRARMHEDLPCYSMSW